MPPCGAPRDMQSPPTSWQSVLSVFLGLVPLLRERVTFFFGEESHQRRHLKPRVSRLPSRYAHCVVAALCRAITETPAVVVSKATRFRSCAAAASLPLTGETQNSPPLSDLPLFPVQRLGTTDSHVGLTPPALVVSAASRSPWSRQAGHFLDSASLHPPPAALRRNPRNDTCFC